MNNRKVTFVEIVSDPELKAREEEASKGVNELYPRCGPAKLYRTPDKQVGLHYPRDLCGMPFLHIGSICVGDRAEFPTAIDHATGRLRRFNTLAPDNAGDEAQSRNSEDLLANEDNPLRSVPFHIVPLMSN